MDARKLLTWCGGSGKRIGFAGLIGVYVRHMGTSVRLH
jgi:hypothetical protein